MRSMKTRSPSTSSNTMSTVRSGVVLLDPRPDLDEGVARLAGLEGHALDDALDEAGVVDAAAGSRREQRLELGGVEAGDRRS